MLKTTGAATQACKRTGTAAYGNDAQTDKPRARRMAGRNKWTTIGAARRFGDGIRIELVDGGTYAIAAEDVSGLIYEGETVPLFQIGDLSAPFRCGEAYWSQSGRMILLAVPGSGRHGAVQVSGAHMCAHFTRGETKPVAVIRPPEPPTLPAGVRLAVV